MAKQLLGKFSCLILSVQQVFESLKLVQDDQIGLKGVNAHVCQAAPQFTNHAVSPFREFALNPLEASEFMTNGAQFVKNGGVGLNAIAKCLRQPFVVFDVVLS